MAETSNDVLVTIGTQLDDKGLKQLNSELEKTGAVASKNADTGALSINKLGDSAKKSSMSFVELAAKVTAAYMAVKSMIDAYTQDAQANAKLTLALKNNTDEVTRQGKSVSDLTKEYKDFASAQQAATGIGDEVTLSLMGTLTTLGVMPKDLKRVTAALQDMEAATGTSADSMARAWARLQDAPDEALGALTRVGVKIRKEMLDGMSVEQQRIFVLEKLEKAFGGQAKVMADATGGVAQAKAAFGDFLEVLGKIVLTIIEPLVRGLTTIMSVFNNMSTPLQILIVGVVGLGVALVSLRTAGVTSLAALSTAVKGFFASLGPIGWAMMALGTLATVLGFIGGSANDIKDADDKIKSLSDTIESLNGAAKSATAIDKLMQKLKGAKYGSDEYNRTVGEVISTNEALKKSNITVANSYVDIANKVRDAYINMNAASLQKALDDSDDLVSTLKSAWEEAQRLKIQPDPVSQAKYSAYLNTIASGMIQLKKMDELIFPGDPNNSQSFISRLASEVTDLESHGDPLSWLTSDVTSRYQRLMQARANAPAGSAYVQPGASVLNTGQSVMSEQKSFIDFERLRMQLITDEFDKRRSELNKYYNDEMDKINESANTKTEKAQAVALLEQDYANKTAEIERAESEATAKAAGEAINKAMSIGTAVIKKDWAGAFGQFADSIVPGVGGAFVSVVNTFGELFATQTESTTAYFGRRFEDAMLAATRSEKIVNAIGNLVGENTASASRISSESALAAITQIQNMLNNPSKYGSTGAKSKIDLFSLDPETTLTAISDIQNRITKGGEHFNPFRELARLTGIEVNAVGVSWSTLVDSITKGLELVKDYQLSSAEEGLAVYRQEIQKIQDQLDTGRMNEEDARSAMIAQYDAAIASLQGVAGAEDLILDLEKERYKLQKGITEETQKQLLNAQQQQTLDQINALERDIATGRARGDYTTYTRLQALYAQLLGSMKSTGLFGTDIYTGIEDRLAGLVRGQIGEAGFSLAAGTGTNALIPTIPASNLYRPSIAVDGRNTTTQQTIVNAPINLPPDFVNWFMRSALAQSQRSFS